MAKSRFPWIHIPQFAEPGAPHAFANREDELCELYNAVVAAGNAVRRGETGVRRRLVVGGYAGVGKSALIQQVLGMIRDELSIADGQKLALPAELIEPDDRERWILLRASGKNAPSVDSLVDAVQAAMLAAAGDVQEQAARKAASGLDLPFFHRLFRSRQARLFEDVRAAIGAVAVAISFVRRWQGSTQTEKLAWVTQINNSSNAQADVEAQLRSKGEAKSADAQAAVKIAAGFVSKRADALSTNVDLERQSTVSAELVVTALNYFFDAADRAGLPTLLVLDDFDEFAAKAGTSHADRARVLEGVLGTFAQLRPTCLVLGLRSEYMNEDVLRQYLRSACRP